MGLERQERSSTCLIFFCFPSCTKAISCFSSNTEAGGRGGESTTWKINCCLCQTSAGQRMNLLVVFFQTQTGPSDPGRYRKLPMQGSHTTPTVKGPHATKKQTHTRVRDSKTTFAYGYQFSQSTETRNWSVLGNSHITTSVLGVPSH